MSPNRGESRSVPAAEDSTRASDEETAPASREEPAPPHLSVVIPAFNESLRIAAPLREVDAYLSAQPYRSELVVVDDGSTDTTCEVVAGLAPELATSLRLFRAPTNRGKGYALKVGFAKASGDRILFTDADLSTPIDEAGALLAGLDAGHLIAVGSRKMPGAQIEVHQPWLRESLGKVFTAIVRALIADVSDATCGFKAFRADVGKALFARVRVYDWSFDAEILRIAALQGIEILEVPVRWHDQEGTKVDLRRDVVNSLVGIGRIGLNSLLGRYEREAPLEGVDEIPVARRMGTAP